MMSTRELSGEPGQAPALYSILSRSGALYEHVLAERQQLRDAVERAYDRFLRARDVLAEALRSEAWNSPTP